MSKRDIILDQATRLFGRYGYLGFTLKQLAKACDMTAPALYYFYVDKAHLFSDCLISEFKARRVMLESCAQRSSSLEEFGRIFAREAIDICNAHEFRAGRAIEEIIHLPEDLQKELQHSWEENLLAPVEAFLDRVAPEVTRKFHRRLVASYIINMATFAAAQNVKYTSKELTTLIVALMGGLAAAAATS